MTTYIVFRRKQQFIVQAETLVRAVQAALLHSGGVASEWNCHALSTYPDHLQTRLIKESPTL